MLFRKRSRFLFVTWDGGDNLPPALAVARRLNARGHHVRFLCDPTLRKDVHAAGFEMSAWTTAPHRRAAVEWGDTAPAPEGVSPLAGGSRRIREFMGDPAPRWAADVMTELEARLPDLVVADYALPAAFIPVEAMGIPLVCIIPHIWPLPATGVPPFGSGFSPALGPVGWIRDAAGRWLAARAAAVATGPLNAARAMFDLEPVESAYEQMLRADEVHVLTSPAFDVVSPDLPTHVHYAGPQFDDATDADEWQPAWGEDDERPRVVAALSRPHESWDTRRIVDALSGLPVRAIVTLTSAAIPPEATSPAPNVELASTVPRRRILQRASLLVTSGDHSTTLEGLAAGVPVLCIPMRRDQSDIAARVVHRGAGVKVPSTATAGQIAAAVVEALSNPKYREGARRLARAMAAGEGCIDPIASHERLAGAPGRI